MALPAHPTSSPSESSREFARRIVARELGANSGDAALLIAVERVCARVGESLSRLFGPYGSLALLTRALARAQTFEKSLSAITVSSAPVPSLRGFAESAGANGAQATAESAVALLAVLGDLIGRLIGADLALSLLEQGANGSSTAGDVQQKEHAQ